MTKRMIMVSSPPASGKTFISMKLAERLKHVVYLDKDSLASLSKQIFVAANQVYDRSSAFFEKYVRDAEYVTIVNMAIDALKYDDIVLINAPFTKEIHSIEYMDSLKNRLKAIGAKLTVIWIVTKPDVCHQRMIARNSDRDIWKLSHWDEYQASVDYTIPKWLDDPKENLDFLIFYNSSDEEFKESMNRIVPLLEEEK